MNSQLVTRPLGQLVEGISSGVSPVCEQRVPEPGDFGVLTLEAFANSTVDTQRAKKIESSKVRSSWTSLVAGALVITRASGSKRLVGKTAVVSEDDPTRFIPDTAWQIVMKRDAPIDSQWVHAFLGSSLGRREIERMARGSSGIWKITKTGLMSVQVPVRPEGSSGTLSRLLAATESQLHAVDALVAAKQKFKQGLMQDLLAGRRRFPEFGAGCVSDSGIGSRGVGWVVTELAQLVTNVTRRNGESDYRVLTVSGAQGLVDQRDYFTKSVAGESTEGYFLLRKGEFAYNRSRMKGYRFGAIKRLDAYDAGALSTLNICFSLTDSRVLSDFLLHYFESGLLDRQLRRIAQEGARAHGLLNVTKADFYRMRVPLPSLPEQSAIVAVLNGLDSELAHLRALAEQLLEQKRGLMQRLFSSDLDLSKLSERVAES